MAAESSEAVRVLVVEDDTWMRDAIEQALGWPESGLCLAASAGTGGEAIRLIKKGINAHVALVDMGLPDMDGTDVIRVLRAVAPQVIPIVFTVQDDPATVFSAIVAGAQGYLSKSTPIQEVLDGLLAARAGGSPITPSVARHVIEKLRGERGEEPDPGLEPLTKRETDVLRLLAKGLTYARAAEVLGIATSTVQGHVKHIYDKLQVNSKAEAATLAQRMGLL